MNRRQFLETTLSAGMVALLSPAWARGEIPPALKIAAFRYDVTPPHGHSLCGGWIKPAVTVDDALEAIGFVLTGADAPIVICAVDWTGLLNQAHVQWRQALAQAAGTSPDRVAVQCVHQHNAPFVCLEAEKIVSEQAGLPHVVQLDFFEECLHRGKQAVTEAMQRLQPITHVAVSQAKVEKVAGNRRFIGPDGKIADWRGSSSKNPRHWELPEGLIDPWMKTVAFYQQDRKLVSCHYYATHPMSFYGDGRISSDFVGLARKRRQAEEADCTHLYFTGCSGNVAAGKYNNGSPEARRQLTNRIYAAMVESEANLQPRPVSRAVWQTAPILIPPHTSRVEEELLAVVSNPKASTADRIRSAMTVGWLRRYRNQVPVILSALHVNQTTLLHLPAECFVEYQLRAQATAPDRFVATAAYGDGGAWYIPVAEAYPQGGYEVSVAFSAPAVDEMISTAMSILKI